MEHGVEMQNGIEFRPVASSGGVPVVVSIGGAVSDADTAIRSRESKATESNHSFFIGAIGNLSVQYNLSCLSIAVTFLTTPSAFGEDPAMREPLWSKNALLGTAFAGAMAGMVVMGWVGDRVGRRLGMIITLAFVVVGALGSALLTRGSPDDFFFVLCVCRLILGWGVGGIYPMAAATAHEGEDVGETAASLNDAAVRVGWAFFWQAPGAMLPYLLAVCLTLLVPSDASWAASLQFRLIVGVGALVASVPLVVAFRAREVHPKEHLPPRSSTRRTQGVYLPVATEAEGDNILQVQAQSSQSPERQSPWITLIGTGGKSLVLCD